LFLDKNSENDDGSSEVLLLTVAFDGSTAEFAMEVN